MTNKQQLTICHMYPKEMNIYGDMGNIIAITKRCEWRGIDVVYTTLNLNQQLQPADIYFMGGGQDSDMYAVFEDLQKHSDVLRAEFNANKVFLLICGAFQLFGEYFLDSKGMQIPGLGIIPAQTKAPGDALADRCLGNLLTELNADLATKIAELYGDKAPKTVVGFENHSGQTYFTSNEIIHFADVLIGKGNNSTQKIEGAKIRNLFGSYTHGSFLPKNPHVADYLIWLALSNKYAEFELKPLDDTVELMAHAQATAKANSSRP